MKKCIKGNSKECSIIKYDIDDLKSELALVSLESKGEAYYKFMCILNHYMNNDIDSKLIIIDWCVDYINSIIDCDYNKKKLIVCYKYKGNSSRDSFVLEYFKAFMSLMFDIKDNRITNNDNVSNFSDYNDHIEYYEEGSADYDKIISTSINGFNSVVYITINDNTFDKLYKNNLSINDVNSSNLCAALRGLDCYILEDHVLCSVIKMKKNNYSKQLKPEVVRILVDIFVEDSSNKQSDRDRELLNLWLFLLSYRLSVHKIKAPILELKCSTVDIYDHTCGCLDIYKSGNLLGDSLDSFPIIVTCSKLPGIYTGIESDFSIRVNHYINLDDMSKLKIDDIYKYYLNLSRVSKYNDDIRLNRIKDDIIYLYNDLYVKEGKIEELTIEEIYDTLRHNTWTFVEEERLKKYLCKTVSYSTNTEGELLFKVIKRIC